MVQSIQQLNRLAPMQEQTKTPIIPDDKSSVNFASMLKNAIEEVNQAEKVADSKAEMLAEGEVENLHDIMLSAQKANITVETAVQVQQKVIDAYNEMMRMQV